MNIDTITKLIELKENEEIEIGIVYPDFEEEELAIASCVVAEFESVIMPFQANIITSSIILIGIFNKEIKEDIENGDIHGILKFKLEPSKDGFKVDVTSHYLDKHMVEIRDGSFRENVNNLLEFLNELKENITSSVNNTVNEYLELSEVGKLREYTLLYENGRNITKYDFVRYTDRPISQQKAEIQELINNGLTGKLYDDIIESNPELIDKQFAVNFKLIDGTNIEDVKIGEF